TTLAHDLRQAFRSLARVPGTAALCAITVALGIGAAATTFSSVYAALYRPAPFPDPGRLVYLNQLRTDAASGTVLLRWSFPTVIGVPLTIRGVMPAAFAGVSGRAAIWIPAALAPRLTYRDYLVTPQHFINLIARLKPDVTLAQANAELAAIGPALPHQALDPS